MCDQVTRVLREALSILGKGGGRGSATQSRQNVQLHPWPCKRSRFWGGRVCSKLLIYSVQRPLEKQGKDGSVDDRGVKGDVRGGVRGAEGQPEAC